MLYIMIPLLCQRYSYMQQLDRVNMVEPCISVQCYTINIEFEVQL